jgi:transposase InsO family protein
VNVDLCFVPVTHQTEVKLPAVSGSSGRLVVERSTSERTAPDYPGLVFAEAERDYAEVMAEFVATSLLAPSKAEVEPPDSLKAQKQALRQEQHQLRDTRRQLRQQRQQEDAAWKQLKQEHRQQANLAWKTLRQQRRQALVKRAQEDEQWRQKRLEVRQRSSQLPLVIVWMAVLVIVDNCSRQCLGLPLFVAGSSVTADMVVAALAELLPPDLQFLISDRGVHFTAKVFQELADTHQFTHVLIARHRPQSNGIAERWVRTLKEWLKDKVWSNDQQLADLLAAFLIYYNDRPHQSLEGLSPNEFAKRVSRTSS